MSIWTYLALALIGMETDALACSITGLRYRPIASAIMALLWPITAPMTILGIIKLQKAALTKAERVPSNANAGERINP